MPSREEMLAALRAPGKKPSREEMLAALRGSGSPEMDKMIERVSGQGITPGSVSRDDAIAQSGLVLQGLDATGGFIRSGLASVAGLVSGKGNVVTEKDLANVAHGKAPTSEEYYERLGVPEGPSVDLNPWAEGKTTARGALGFLTDVGTGSLRPLAPSVRPLSSGAEKAGKATYKSGLKRIDQEVAKYGKEPVSELLWDNRITGSAKGIFEKMDKLGDKLYGERQKILTDATREGAEVDMKQAMSKAQDYVDKLKKVDNPELRPAVQMMQNRINKYLDVGAKESEQTLRTLPTSEFVPEYRPITGYEPGKENFIELPRPKISKEASFNPEVPYYEAETLSGFGLLDTDPSVLYSGKDLLRGGAPPKGRLKAQPSEPVIRDQMDQIKSLPIGASYDEVFRPGMDVGLEQIPGKVNYGPIVPSRFKPGKEVTVLDETERVAGPNPLQTSAWKTTSANKAGDAAWESMARSKEGKSFEKALSGGLRKSTEDAVGKLLGQEKALELAKKNADLGKILTSKERALMDAEQELRKNLFTSVDGMILGSGSTTMAVVKKLADFMKMTGPRTKGGLLLHDTGKSGLLDTTARQGLINQNKKKDDKRSK